VLKAHGFDPILSVQEACKSGVLAGHPARGSWSVALPDVVGKAEGAKSKSPDMAKYDAVANKFFGKGK